MALGNPTGIVLRVASDIQSATCLCTAPRFQWVLTATSTAGFTLVHSYPVSLMLYLPCSVQAPVVPFVVMGGRAVRARQLPGARLPSGHRPGAIVNYISKTNYIYLIWAMSITGISRFREAACDSCQLPAR